MVCASDDMFYGWIILLVAGSCAYFSGPGQTSGVSSFIEGYLTEFNWTRSEVSFFYFIATCSSALVQTHVGVYIDRHGCLYSAKRICACFAGSCIFNGLFVHDKVSCTMGFFLIRLFGQGALTLVAKTLVPRWFIRKRGKAMGLLSLGWLLAQATIPSISTYIIREHGWRECWMFWGLVELVCLFPLVSVLIVNKPQDMGLLPDGDSPAKGRVGGDLVDGEHDSEDLGVRHGSAGLVSQLGAREADESGAATSKQRSLTPARTPDEVGYTISEALRTPAFWALSLCSVEGSAVHTAVMFHAVSIVEISGTLSATTAAAMIAARSFVGAPVNIIAGGLVDRFGPRYVISGSFLVQAAGLFFLVGVDSHEQALVSGGVLGAASALSNIGLSTIIPETFGTNHLGSITGLFSTTGVGGSALGPLLFGLAFDASGSYDTALLVSVLFCFLCTVVALVYATPSKEPVQPARQ